MSELEGRFMDEDEPMVIAITHLRDSLGYFYQHIADTDRPLIIQRYRDQSVVMVPFREWQWLKQIEDKVRAGEPVIPAEEPEASFRDALQGATRFETDA